MACVRGQFIRDLLCSRQQLQAHRASATNMNGRVGQPDVRKRSDNERKTAQAHAGGPLEHPDLERALVRQLRLVSAELGAVHP